MTERAPPPKPDIVEQEDLVTILNRIGAIRRFADLPADERPAPVSSRQVSLRVIEGGRR
jgi:hypothetical protein